MKYTDLFSRQASIYAKFRPSYPAELFQFLVSVCNGNELAVDCGAGNGQASNGIAKMFDNVFALDPSIDQLQKFHSSDNIKLINAAAEKIPLKSASADLLISAQAAHWFEFEQFYSEVKRILKPNGIIALWCYYLPSVNKQIDAVLLKYYMEIVGKYWAEGRKWIDDKYQNIPFPFKEIKAPEFDMQTQSSLSDYFGFLETWSATNTYIKQTNRNPIEKIVNELKKVWGNPNQIHKLNWKLYMRTGINK